MISQLKLVKSFRNRRLLSRFYSISSSTYDTDIEFSNGRKITIRTGHLAKFSDGCAIVKSGETAVMCTAISKPKPSTSSFLPLTVDYRLKSAAAGRIPTNFMRREMGTSESEILSARLVDRSIRPLFSKDYRCDTQLVCNVLAVDSMNKPDVHAINAASAALHLSDIPWNGPLAAVRMGMINNELIVNPTRRELQHSNLDLIVAATKQNLVVMLEGKGDLVLLPDLLKAIKQGTREAQTIIDKIEKMRKELPIAKAKRAKFEGLKTLSPEVIEAIRATSSLRLKDIFRNVSHDKLSRDNAVNVLRQEVTSSVWSSFPDSDINQIIEEFNKVTIASFREFVLDENIRCDGRGFDDLRKITCEVDVFKPLHGSAIFTRGQTQVFCSVTLDSKESALKLDSLNALESGLKEKNFFVHYEFPPYAVGEIGKIGGVNRRELGHGALAEKGLVPIIPQNSPFTIRLSSEVLESNGSSSMATVCGGTLALMDAGIQISSPAAGVAIGLITKYNNDDTKHIEDYRILTDQLGIEDYMGDMDMKVSGTKKGISSIQTDLKIPGIPLKIVNESLQKSVDAKSKIIDILRACIDSPRLEKKDSWPVSEKMKVEPHQRSKIIGPGGIHVKQLFLETGVQMTQIDENSFSIFAPSKSAMDEAKEYIQKLLEKDRVPELDFGGIYTAKIVELRDIGAMVTLYPSMPPTLLHNSQLDMRKVAHPSALGLEVGQEISVKYFGRDPVSGLMRLSRKVLQSPASARVRNLDKNSSLTLPEKEK